MQGGILEVSLHAPGYKIIETNTIQPGDNGIQAYAMVDEEQGIIWIWKDTPPDRRQAVISEALQAAARVQLVPVVSVSL